MGAIENVLALCDMPEEAEIVASARAELAALRAENARLRWATQVSADMEGETDERVLASMARAASAVAADALSGSAPRGAWLSAAQLREIEWAATREGDWDSAYADTKACPVCFVAEGGKHAPDCRLARAIKQAEEAA